MINEKNINKKYYLIAVFKAYYFLVAGFSIRITSWTQSDLRFCENESSKRSTMTKEVKWIENKEKIDTKCLKSVE